MDTCWSKTDHNSY